MTAALWFLQEHQSRRYVDAVSVSLADGAQYPRLPNERLYLEP
ncbi:hypothetical protein ACFYT3_23030 [Nocardia amikacinitolerans]